ncbi:MAG TPA: DinB family protein, partial [Longimicrobium sp.]|nr:DinB family protein [Longimicrobium sp.]
AIAAGLPPAPADAEGDSVLGSLDRFRIEERRRRVDALESARPTHGLARAELLDALAASRAGLLELLRAAAPHDVSGVIHKHPALGDLNLYEWLVFVGKHELRHAAQIGEARAGIASKA